MEASACPLDDSHSTPTPYLQAPTSSNPHIDANPFIIDYASPNHPRFPIAAELAKKLVINMDIMSVAIMLGGGSWGCGCGCGWGWGLGLGLGVGVG